MSEKKLFRVLSLDGRGAKGFYTLGILREIEALIKCPLHERFDLIFGTSTGSIIASMLALGKSVQEIIALYQDHVPTVMKHEDADGRSGALADLSNIIFKDTMFTDVKTNVGVVTTKWVLEQPMIFKGDIAQAHGQQGSFVPGFGVKVGDAVQASCSAYPYFNRKTVVTSNGDNIELIDGGFCANNPTLYAIADATISMQIPSDDIRVVSLGCGTYPPNPLSKFTWDYWKQRTPGVQLLQKTLEINMIRLAAAIPPKRQKRSEPSHERTSLTRRRSLWVGSVSPIPVTSRHTVGPGCRLASQGDERQLRRSRHRARSPSYVCCTLEPVVGDTIFLMGERPEVARHLLNVN